MSKETSQNSAPEWKNIALDRISYGSGTKFYDRMHPVGQPMSSISIAFAKERIETIFNQVMSDIDGLGLGKDAPRVQYRRIILDAKREIDKLIAPYIEFNRDRFTTIMQQQGFCTQVNDIVERLRSRGTALPSIITRDLGLRISHEVQSWRDLFDLPFGDPLDLPHVWQQEAANRVDETEAKEENLATIQVPAEDEELFQQLLKIDRELLEDIARDPDHYRYLHELEAEENVARDGAINYLKEAKPLLQPLGLFFNSVQNLERQWFKIKAKLKALEEKFRTLPFGHLSSHDSLSKADQERVMDVYADFIFEVKKLQGLMEVYAEGVKKYQWLQGSKAELSAKVTTLQGVINARRNVGYINDEDQSATQDIKFAENTLNGESRAVQSFQRVGGELMHFLGNAAWETRLAQAIDTFGLHGEVDLEQMQTSYQNLIAFGELPEEFAAMTMVVEPIMTQAPEPRRAPARRIPKRTRELAAAEGSHWVFTGDTEDKLTFLRGLSGTELIEVAELLPKEDEMPEVDWASLEPKIRHAVIRGRLMMNSELIQHLEIIERMQDLRYVLDRLPIGFLRKCGLDKACFGGDDASYKDHWELKAVVYQPCFAKEMTHQLPGLVDPQGFDVNSDAHNQDDIVFEMGRRLHQGWPLFEDFEADDTPELSRELFGLLKDKQDLTEHFRLIPEFIGEAAVAKTRAKAARLLFPDGFKYKQRKKG